MDAHLHPFPTHLEKWLLNFNPDSGLLAEEHINNFMSSINLNEVVEEDSIEDYFHIICKEQQDHGTSHYHKVILIVGMLFKSST